MANQEVVSVRLVVERERQFLAAMERARRAVRDLLGSTRRGVNVRITADARAATDELGRLSRAFGDLNGRTANIAVDAATQAARDELTQVESALRGLDGATANVSVSSASRAAVDALQGVLSVVRGADGARANVSVSANVRGALDDLSRVDAAIRGLSTNAALSASADVQSAIDGIALVESAIRGISGATAAISVDANIAAARDALAVIEGVLRGLDGARASLAVDADIAGANDALATIQSVLRGLDGSAAGVTANADVQAAIDALATVESVLRGLDGARAAISVDANVASAIDALANAETTLRGISGLTAGISIDASTQPALDAIAAVESVLRSLDGVRASVSVDASTTAASEALAIIESALASLDGARAAIAVDADIQAARDALATAQSDLRGLDGLIAGVTVDANVSAAIDAIARAEAALRALDGATATLTVDASVSAAQDALSVIESVLRSLDGARSSVQVDASVTGATDALSNIEGTLRGISGATAGISVDANIQAALDAIQRIEGALRSLDGSTATVIIDAITAAARDALATVQSDVRGLDGSTATVTAQANTGGARAALAQLITNINDADGRRVTITADADTSRASSGLFSLVSTASDAGASAGNAFGSSFQQVVAGFNLSIGNAIFRGVSGAARAAVGPIGEAFNFENVVADTAAIVSAGVEQIDPDEATRRIEALIQEAATSTELLADDRTVAAALQALIRGGTTLAQAEAGALAEAIRFQNLAGSTGTQEEFALGGETLSVIRAINQLGAEDLPRVSQVATAVLGQSKISDINELAFGFTGLAAAVASSNLTLEEQGALLIQTANGFKSSRTQTDAISRLYTELRSPTEKQAEAQAELGIQYRDANGNIIDAIELQRQLRAAFNDTGRSVQEIDALFGAAFGSNAYEAIVQLIQGQDLQQILDNIQGVSVPVALDLRTSTSARIFENLGGIISSNLRQVFSGAVEALRPIAVSLSELFQTLQPRFAEIGDVLSAVLQPFNDQIVASISQVTGLAEAGAPLLEVFGALVREAITLADTIGGQVISTISTLFGGDYQVATFSQAFRDVRDYINEWLTPAREFFATISQIADAVGGVVESFETGGLFGEGGLVGSFFGGGGLFGEGGIGSLLSGLTENNFVREAIKLQLQALLLPVEDVEELFTTLSTAFTTFRDSIQAVTDPIGTALSAITDLIGGFLTRAQAQSGQIAETTADVASRSGLGTIVERTTSPTALERLTGANEIAQAQAAGVDTSQNNTQRVTPTGIEFTSNPVLDKLDNLPTRLSEAFNQFATFVVRNGGLIASPAAALVGGVGQATAQQQPEPVATPDQPTVPDAFRSGQVVDVNVVNLAGEALSNSPLGTDGTAADLAAEADRLLSAAQEQRQAEGEAEARIQQQKIAEEAALSQAQTRAETDAAALESLRLLTESLGLVPEPATATSESLATIPEPATATSTALALIAEPANATVLALGGLASAISIAVAHIQAAALTAANVARSAAAAASAASPGSGSPAAPNDGIVPGRARGGPISGTALVGELGRELFYNPRTGTAGIVGQNGPELRNFAAGTTILPADQTARVLSRGVRSAVDGAGPIGSLFDFLRGLTGSANNVTRQAESGLIQVDSEEFARQLNEINTLQLDQAQQQLDAQQVATEAATESAQAQQTAAAAVQASLQQINDVLARSAVTAEDVAATADGTYQDKTDEFVRRLAAAANGSGFEETLGQAAEALELIGVSPSANPQELYKQFTEAWDNRTLFYAEQNLDLINTAAIAEQGAAATAAAEAQALLDEKAATGVANLQTYLGQFIDTSVASVAAALGGGAEGAQAGSGGQETTAAPSAISGAVSALSEAFSSLSGLVAGDVYSAFGSARDAVNSAVSPIQSLGSNADGTKSKVKALGDVIESTVEEIRKLLRGGDGTTETPSPDPIGDSQALGGRPKAGITLTGEGGREIWYNAALRQAGIVGDRGPEFVNFDPGTRVFDAEESARILARSGGSARPVYNSAAFGINFDPGPSSGGSILEDALTPIFSNSGSSNVSAPTQSFSSLFKSNPAFGGISSISESGSRSAVAQFSQTGTRNRLSQDLAADRTPGVATAVTPVQEQRQRADLAREFTQRLKGSVNQRETRVVNNINNTTMINSNNQSNVDYGGLQVSSLRSVESVAGDFRQFRTLYG